MLRSVLLGYTLQCQVFRAIQMPSLRSCFQGQRNIFQTVKGLERPTTLAIPWVCRSRKQTQTITLTRGKSLSQDLPDHEEPEEGGFEDA